jgi:hypothetical protein
MRLPYHGKSKESETLHVIFADVAQRCDVLKTDAAHIVFAFLRQVAERLCHGDEIQLQNFGSFVPDHYVHPISKERKVRVRFIPARPLRKTVAAMCHPDVVDEARIERLIKRSKPSSKSGGGDVFAGLDRVINSAKRQSPDRYTMRQIRATILAKVESPHFEPETCLDGRPPVLGAFSRKHRFPGRTGRPPRHDVEPYVDVLILPNDAKASRYLRQHGIKKGRRRLFGPQWEDLRIRLVRAGITVIPKLTTEPDMQAFLTEQARAQRVKKWFTRLMADGIRAEEDLAMKRLQGPDGARQEVERAILRRRPTPAEERDYLSRRISEARHNRDYSGYVPFDPYHLA